MKNKTIRLLLLTLLPGCLVVSFVIITRFRESPKNTLLLNEVWIFQAGERVISTPILIDDQIIFQTANKIYSINAVDGSAIWEIAARASDITMLEKPLIGNSKLLVSEEQGNSIGIYSTKTGKKIWSVDGQLNFINALEIVDNVMIVARHDGDLVVYDLTSRKKLWDDPLPPRSGTPVAVNKDLVILGAEDVLRVYGLKDGSILNAKSFGESFVGELLLSGSNIFVSYAHNGDYSVSSLQLDSLNEKWVFHAGEEISYPYLSIAGDQLSVFNQNLILLDVNSGSVLWKDDSQKYYSAPAFHENSLFFISVKQMFSNNKEMCKIEMTKDAMKDCTLVDRTGRLVTSQSYLLGPLATDSLLIVPRGSEIVAFTMP